MPSEDLKAQLVVALIQLNLLPEEPWARKWLQEYVSNTYRIRFRLQEGGAVGNLQERDAAVAIVAGLLIDRWSFPEDYRAFRKYVRTQIWLTLREFGSSKIGSGFEVEAGAEGKEPETLPAEAEDTLTERISRHDRPVALIGCHNATVSEAAEFLNCTESRLYRLRKRNLVQASGEPMRIPRSELVRLRAISQNKTERRAEIQRLVRRGMTKDAARKAVYRRHKSHPANGP